MLDLSLFIKEKFSINFLYELCLSIIILVIGIVSSCIFSNNITKLINYNDKNTNINYLLLLIHLIIIVYFIIIIRYILNYMITDKDVLNAVSTLTGPTIGASSLFYSQILKDFVNKFMFL